MNTPISKQAKAAHADTPIVALDKFKNLVSRPDVIQGNPDDLVDIRWGYDVNLHSSNTHHKGTNETSGSVA